MSRKNFNRFLNFQYEFQEKALTVVVENEVFLFQIRPENPTLLEEQKNNDKIR
jgi:hypothetical protein